MKQFLPYLCFLMVWLTTSVAVAQQPSKREKIEALRVSFISQKVNFTTQEAQQFWPLYNEYSDKLELNRRTFRQQFKKKQERDFATDKEAEAYLSAELNMKQKEVELYKEYYEKFRKILPVKKVALLRLAEEDFKKELIKNIKGNSQE